MPAVEKVLSEIRDDGGTVMYDKDPQTKNVDVLWLQTKEMRKKVSETKLRTFETDTTFGTQKEGYKLYIPLYHSNETIVLVN